MGKYKIVTIILLLIVLVETGMLLQQPVSTIQSFDDSLLREHSFWYKNKSIKFLEQKISDLYIGIDSLKREYEAYDSIEPEIKHYYHEIYIDIKHASNAKLDSLLRSSWWHT